MFVIITTATGNKGLFKFIGFQENFIIVTKNENLYYLPKDEFFPTMKFLSDNSSIQTEKKSECCICYEENVSPNKQTKCGHNMCQSCTNQLEKLECAYCKAQLSINSGYITKELKSKIDERIMRNKKISDIINELMVYHITYIPERTLKYNHEDYAYAFKYILEDSNIVNEVNYSAILEGYKKFITIMYNLEQNSSHNEERPEDVIIKQAADILNIIYNF